jgi:hypothetical protein
MSSCRKRTTITAMADPFAREMPRAMSYGDGNASITRQSGRAVCVKAIAKLPDDSPLLPLAQNVLRRFF